MDAGETRADRLGPGPDARAAPRARPTRPARLSPAQHRDGRPRVSAQQPSPAAGRAAHGGHEARRRLRARQERTHARLYLQEGAE